MSETLEHKKALVIWRLRRDLEALKDLCLRIERGGMSNADVRKFLIELHCYHENLRHRLLD